MSKYQKKIFIVIENFIYLIVLLIKIICTVCPLPMFQKARTCVMSRLSAHFFPTSLVKLRNTDSELVKNSNSTILLLSADVSADSENICLVESWIRQMRKPLQYTGKLMWYKRRLSCTISIKRFRIFYIAAFASCFPYWLLTPAAKKVLLSCKNTQFLCW